MDTSTDPMFGAEVGDEQQQTIERSGTPCVHAGVQDGSVAGHARAAGVGGDAVGDRPRAGCATEFIAVMGTAGEGARWRRGPRGAVWPAARPDGGRRSASAAARKCDAAPRARFLKK